MRGRRRLPWLAALAPALLCCGCIEYVIESPHHSVVLSRGKGQQVAELARRDETAIFRQRQFGLFDGLIFRGHSKFADTMKGNELKGAGIVTGLHASDVLVAAVTRIQPLGYFFSIVTSHTIRVYIDVQ